MVSGSVVMGCLKGESEVKKKAAKFECAKCGAKAKKKDHVCKPVKLEAPQKNSPEDKTKK
jgi:predicted RNA-binding Zn-ribbon protein involved in translation (DUF1610 family)